MLKGHHFPIVALFSLNPKCLNIKKLDSFSFPFVVRTQKKRDIYLLCMKIDYPPFGGQRTK